ncbi:AAA family ATPase [Roseinatronobacter sp.]
MTQHLTSSGPDSRNGSSDPAPWQAFAKDILQHLLGSTYAEWAYTDWFANPKALAQTADQPQDGKAQQPQGKESPEQKEDPTLDEILDSIEREGSHPLIPEQSSNDTRTVPDVRPRASVVMSVLRLARQFGSLHGFRTQICNPDTITLLCSGAGEMNSIIKSVLRAIAQLEPDTAGHAALHVTTAAAVTLRKDRDTGGPFAKLTPRFLISIEEGQPIALIAPSLSSLSKDLRELATGVIELPRFDRDMLDVLLTHMYPDYAPPEDTDLPETLSPAAVARLTADDLTLACRAPTPAGACARLLERLFPPKPDEPGLAEFPLEDHVRAAVDQMLADLRDWKAGVIPWPDVSRGLLLAGPPGCGKTEIPRLIAREAGINVRAGSLNQWHSAGGRSGELLQKMQQFFEEAAAASPCIAFIDEIDAFGDRNRARDHNSAWTDYVVSGLLQCLDGFDGREGVVVIAATNHVAHIDAALCRPGRFDRTVRIAQPSPELMAQAFRWHLSRDLAGVDLSGIAAAATGMTGAEVAATVRDAKARARHNRVPLAHKHVMAAVQNRRPPLDPALRHLVAIHECGHAIVAQATGCARTERLFLTTDGGRASMTRPAIKMQRDDLNREIACLLAGRAAEKLILGQASGGAGGGSDSDLARATATAAAMEYAWGLGDRATLWRAPPDTAIDRLFLDPHTTARVQARLDAADATATQILTRNRALLEEMADALMKRQLLSGPELAALLRRVTRESARTGSDQSDSPPQATGTRQPQNTTSLTKGP